MTSESSKSAAYQHIAASALGFGSKIGSKNYARLASFVAKTKGPPRVVNPTATPAADTGAEGRGWSVAMESTKPAL